MEQNFSALVKETKPLHSKTFKYLVLISSFQLPSHRFICACTVYCIKCRLSISQLKSCSQDSFPAGLRSSVVPLHPVDFRSTDACQTEYTPDCSGLGQKIFLQLLDITGANKHSNQFAILNQHKMLRWTDLNRTNYHYDGVQLQENDRVDIYCAGLLKIFFPFDLSGTF